MGEEIMKFDTPISDRHRLSFAYDYESLNDREKAQAWAMWSYELGLELDDIISWRGVTNAQRIELAIQKIKWLKRLEAVAKAAREIAECEPYYRDYALSGNSDPRVCYYCGAPWEHKTSQHKPGCPLEKLRQALAALEGGG